MITQSIIQSYCWLCLKYMTVFLKKTDKKSMLDVKNKFNTLHAIIYHDSLVWDCRLKNCKICIVDHSNSDYHGGYGLIVKYKHIIKYMVIEKVNLIAILNFIKNALNITTQIS